MKRIGMVLEGGGLRGLYTAGVLDVLMENNIKVDGIIGVSAGALFGVNYFSKQKGRVIRYNKQYCKNRHYMSMISFLLTGNYINKNFAFYKMNTELDQFDNLTYSNNNKDFYAVATKVEDGTPEYFKITDPINQLEQLRASSAIPALSRIVKIDGIGYLDGGISDSIPIDKCIELGYDKRIVIETQPLNYRKKPLKLGKARFLKLRYFRYPKLVKTMLERHDAYNAQKDKVIELERKGQAFAIRPIKSLDIDIRNKNPMKYQEVYDRGVEDAKNALENLIKYLEDDKKKTTKKKTNTKTTTKRGRKSKEENKEKKSDTKKKSTSKNTTTKKTTTTKKSTSAKSTATKKKTSTKTTPAKRGRKPKEETKTKKTTAKTNVTKKKTSKSKK